MNAQPPSPWSKVKLKTRPQTSEGVNKFEAARRAGSQNHSEVLANKFERARVQSGAQPEQPEPEIIGNPFDRYAAKKGNPIAPLKNRSGLIEDSRLKAAREAEEARKAALNTPKRQSADFHHSDADWAAILIAWVHRSTPAFVATQFNAENLARMLDHQCALGTCGYDSASLTACHVWLYENGFYEEAPNRRKRGQEPPKTYPVYEPKALKPDNSLMTKHRTVVSQEEMTDLRNEDFDSLAARARSTNKARDPRKTVTHI